MEGTVTATAGAFDYFTLIWNALVLPIQTAETAIMDAMQGYVTTWFALAVSVYLMAALLRAALTPGEEGAAWFFRQLFLASVVYSLAALAAYSTYAVGLSTGLVTHVNAAIVGTFGGTAITGPGSFDAMANNMIAVGAVTMKHVPWYAIVKGIGMLLIVDFFIIAAIIAIGLMFVLFMLSSVMLGFLLAFGPLFVACYMFPFTRQFFDGWLRTIVAAALTQIFIVGLSTLFSVVVAAVLLPITAALNGADGPGGDIFPELVSLLVLLVTCAIFVWLAFHVASLAQSIAGGAHAQFNRLPIPRLSVPFPSAGGGGGAGQASAGGGSGGGRAYAFSRNVGGAS